MVGLAARLGLAAMAAAGCGPTVTLVASPELSTLEEVPLARRLTVTTESASFLRLRALSDRGGFEVAWPEAQRAHDVPVLGLKPGRDWTIEVYLGPEGADRRVATFDVRTGPLPPDFPVADVRSFDADAVEPGYLLANVRRVTETGSHWLVAWDLRDLEVAWLGATPFNFGDVRRTAEGTLIGLRGMPTESDFLLRTVVRWTPEPEAPEEVDLPVAGAHHELYVEPDGSLLTLPQYAHQSEAYPLDLADPEGDVAPARLISSRVVRFAPDGTLLWKEPLGDVLDDRRISMSSLIEESFGFDWIHANAVIPGKDGAGAVVSLRHQDALVKIDDEGELEWILGDPAGWSAPFRPYLLQPEGELGWAYHPHAPAWAPDGTLVVFDNHNFGHTPYTPPPAEAWSSRVVAYEITPAAGGGGTVREVWSWRPDGDPLQSPRMGDADPLPETGHVLANFGWIEEGDRDADDNPEEVSMRLVQFDPRDGTAPLDLWFRAPDDGGAPGVRSYRSEIVPSLYADEVRVTPIADP